MGRSKRDRDRADRHGQEKFYDNIPVIHKPCKKAGSSHRFLTRDDLHFVKYFQSDACRIEGCRIRIEKNVLRAQCLVDETLTYCKEVIQSVLKRQLSYKYFEKWVTNIDDDISNLWTSLHEMGGKYRFSNDERRTGNRLLKKLLDEEFQVYDILPPTEEEYETGSYNGLFDWLQVNWSTERMINALTPCSKTLVPKQKEKPVLTKKKKITKVHHRLLTFTIDDFDFTSIKLPWEQDDDSDSTSTNSDDAAAAPTATGRSKTSTNSSSKPLVAADSCYTEDVAQASTSSDTAHHTHLTAKSSECDISESETTDTCQTTESKNDDDFYVDHIFKKFYEEVWSSLKSNDKVEDNDGEKLAVTLDSIVDRADRSLSLRNSQTYEEFINCMNSSILLLKLLKEWSTENKRHINLIPKLIDFGAKVDFFNAWCPISILAVLTEDIDLIKIIFKNIDDFYLLELLGWNEHYLHAAVRTNNLVVVKTVNELVDGNGKSEIYHLVEQSKTELTPFQLAVKLQYHDIVEYFISLQKPSYKTGAKTKSPNRDYCDEGLMHSVAKNNDVKMAKLLKLPRNKSESALIVAIENDCKDMIQYLKPTMFTRDINRKGRIIKSRKVEHPVLVKAFVTSSARALEYLLNAWSRKQDQDAITVKALLQRTQNPAMIRVFLAKYYKICNSRKELHETAMDCLYSLVQWDLNFELDDKKLCEFRTLKHQLEILSVLQGYFYKFCVPDNSHSAVCVLLQYMGIVAQDPLQNLLVPSRLALLKALLKSGDHFQCMKQEASAACSHMMQAFLNLKSGLSSYFYQPSYSIMLLLLQHNVPLEFFQHNARHGSSILIKVIEDPMRSLPELELLIDAGIGLSDVVPHCQKVLDELDDYMELLESQDLSDEMYEKEQLQIILKRIASLPISPRSLVTLAKVAFRRSLGFGNVADKISKFCLPLPITNIVLGLSVPELFDIEDDENFNVNVNIHVKNMKALYKLLN